MRPWINKIYCDTCGKLIYHRDDKEGINIGSSYYSTQIDYGSICWHIYEKKENNYSWSSIEVSDDLDFCSKDCFFNYFEGLKKQRLKTP